MIYPTLGPGEYLDLDGCIMPTTSHSVYIAVDTKKELRELVKLQKSAIFQFLVHSFRSMRSPRDYVWKNIKKGEFDLSESEVEYIERNMA